jgi:hypothetical protein
MLGVQFSAYRRLESSDARVRSKGLHRRYCGAALQAGNIGACAEAVQKSPAAGQLNR